MADLIKQGLGKILPEGAAEKVEQVVEAAKPVADIAAEVIQGKWGNGKERETKLTEAGYDFAAIQKEVNKLLGGK